MARRVQWYSSMNTEYWSAEDADGNVLSLTPRADGQYRVALNGVPRWLLTPEDALAFAWEHMAPLAVCTAYDTRND